MKSDGTAQIGFIGAGWWATANHMPVFAARDDVEMTAVCRLGADELQLVKETFGFVHTTENYEELLDIEGLDGIVVSTPHSLHYEHTMAALKRGLHVMCEKPLATSATDARAMVTEAEKQGVELIIPHGWHYAPYVQKAKEIMDQHPVGNIEFMMCHMASPVRSLLEGKQFLAAGGGASDNMFEPGAETWADPVIAGGGYALAQMTHSAGMAYWLTELQAETVFAYNTSPTARVELYNAFTVGFKDGAIGTFSGAGALPQDQTFQLDIRIFGEEGAFVLDIDRARLEVQRHDGDHIKVNVDLGAGEYYGGGPPHNFADILLGKDVTNWAPGWAGMRAIEMIDAAYRSAKSGVVERV